MNEEKILIPVVFKFKEKLYYFKIEGDILLEMVLTKFRALGTEESTVTDEFIVRVDELGNAIGALIEFFDWGEDFEDEEDEEEDDETLQELFNKFRNKSKIQSENSI